MWLTCWLEGLHSTAAVAAAAVVVVVMGQPKVVVAVPMRLLHSYMRWMTVSRISASVPGYHMGALPVVAVMVVVVVVVAVVAVAAAIVAVVMMGHMW